MPKIFERASGVTYQREFGENPVNRIPVTTLDPDLANPMFRHPWVQILMAAQTNRTLSDALHNAVMIYELTKNHDE